MRASLNFSGNPATPSSTDRMSICLPCDTMNNMTSSWCKCGSELAWCTLQISWVFEVTHTAVRVAGKCSQPMKLQHFEPTYNKPLYQSTWSSGRCQCLTEVMSIKMSFHKIIINFWKYATVISFFLCTWRSHNYRVYSNCGPGPILIFEEEPYLTRQS